MPDLATWANLGEVIGGVAVLLAGGFAVIELRRARHARDQMAAQTTMQVLQQASLLRAVRKLLTLPDGADPVAIEGDEEMAQAAAEAGTAFVTFGMHLFTGVSTWKVSSQGNPWLVYQVWKRTHRWVQASRHVVGPSNFWCFEWLVGQYQAAGLVPLEPAADREPYQPGDGMEAV